MTTENGKLFEDLNDKAIENFREYLRIPSVQPNVDYSDCLKFLEKQAKSLELPIKVLEVHPKKPVVIITWLGTDSALPSILLNSHMDVVPVYEKFWTHPPFAAEMDDDGNIYARGSQDMKCVGIQYLEAIRRLKLEGKKPERTIHVTFVPDEEIGGQLGMKLFVKTPEFEALNVGFALDEGCACPLENMYYLFYGERCSWNIWVHCTGNTGHGSQLLENTAGEKLQVIINKFMDFRAKEKERLKDPKLNLGDITTLNMTMLEGGVQNNVIPQELKVAFDMRVDIGKDHKEMEDMIDQWCKEAGEGVFYKFQYKEPKVPCTRIDEKNIYWQKMKSVFEKSNTKLLTAVLPGGTDIRYIRALGVPAISFSPMNNTKILLHDHDEYLNKNVFIEGIKVYTELLAELADVKIA